MRINYTESQNDNFFFLPEQISNFLKAHGLLVTNNSKKISSQVDFEGGVKCILLEAKRPKIIVTKFHRNRTNNDVGLKKSVKIEFFRLFFQLKLIFRKIRRFPERRIT